MLDSITKNWWIVLLRGLCAVLFGILALGWPGITLASLVLVFGFYAIIDGVTSIAVGLSGGALGERWWQMLLVGIISIVAGVWTFSWPAVTAIALLLLIAVWSIVRGGLEIYAAIRLRKVIENESLLILAGVCSMIFGAVLFVQPAAGALAVLWIIGVYAFVFGILTMALAFKLRSLKPHSAPLAATM